MGSLETGGVQRSAIMDRCELCARGGLDGTAPTLSSPLLLLLQRCVAFLAQSVDRCVAFGLVQSMDGGVTDGVDKL